MANEPEPNNAESGGGDPGQTFSLRYVQDLRQESAGYRVRAKDAEAKVARANDLEAQLSDAKRTNALLRAGVSDMDFTEYLLKKSGRWDFDPNDEEQVSSRI